MSHGARMDPTSGFIFKGKNVARCAKLEQYEIGLCPD
jgi:hypothetical protein